MQLLLHSSHKWKNVLMASFLFFSGTQINHRIWQFVVSTWERQICISYFLVLYVWHYISQLMSAQLNSFLLGNYAPASFLASFTSINKAIECMVIGGCFWTDPQFGGIVFPDLMTAKSKHCCIISSALDGSTTQRENFMIAVIQLLSHLLVS